MSSYCLIILSLIFPLPCISAQPSSFNKEISLMENVSKTNALKAEINVKDVEHQGHANSLQLPETVVSATTTNLRSFKGQSLLHHRFNLGNVHGTLNIIGWGTLLPIGAITARYLRKFPLQYDEWYPLHVLCQSLGYILGTIGWGIGLWLGNSSKHYTLKAHRILGIIVFIFATIQMLTTLLQPKREDKCRKYWQRYHHVMGYTVIALSIANIFEGIKQLSHLQAHAAERWKWVYLGILAALVSLAIAMELYRWIIKSRIHQQMAFDNNIYNFT